MEEFVRRTTRLAPAPFVPEIRLYQAGDLYDVWQQTERERGEADLPPPFWAVAWPGGQALARHLLDNPGLVAGRRVVDFGSGSGLVAIAAARSGAAAVTAVETDPFALAAIALNTTANEVAVTARTTVAGLAADIVVAGDVWYEKELARLVMDIADQAGADGADVLAGDIGRTYFPHERFHRVANYRVPASTALERSDVLRASVWTTREARREVSGG
ncbi:MAG TPA: 50S ribosomal protein L11 methyltransferase [Trebonia sp.]|nr:50S ribosomal protein L11 methyltransferase [Trebonia sp.]